MRRIDEEIKGVRKRRREKLGATRTQRHDRPRIRNDLADRFWMGYGSCK